MLAHEPKIVINNIKLTEAQAMAVRVACTAFLGEMASDTDALGSDEHGRRMTAAYAKRLGEVIQHMQTPKKAQA